MSFRPYTEITTAGLSDNRSNNTGSAFTKGTPARINNSGELDFINVSIESDIKGVVGVTSEAIANGSAGSVATSGKVSDITTTAALGDTLYIDKTGALTNIEPDVGVNSFVAGDFVIAIGVVAKNESNPVLKDLIIFVDIRGQL